MVKFFFFLIGDFFASLGVTHFVRGYFNRRRFKSKIRQCEKLNRWHNGKHIVVRYKKKPLLLNKRTFKDLKAQGWFPRATWGDMQKIQVTLENL